MSDLECISIVDVDGVTVVTMNDNKVMDPARIQTLGDELLELADGVDESKKILINLANVQFLSSAAINKLIVLEKRLKTLGGTIKLSNVTPEVRDVFSITHLNNVFDICESQKDAIHAFATGSV